MGIGMNCFAYSVLLTAFFGVLGAKGFPQTEDLNSAELQYSGLYNHDYLGRPRRSPFDEDERNDVEGGTSGIFEGARTKLEEKANDFVDEESSQFKQKIEDGAEGMKEMGEEKVDDSANYVKAQGQNVLNQTITLVSDASRKAADKSFDYLESLGVSKGIVGSLSGLTNTFMNLGQEIASDVGHTIVDRSSQVLKTTGDGLVKDSVDTGETAGIEETNVAADSAKETISGVLHANGKKLKVAAKDFAKGTVDTGRDMTKGAIKTVKNAAENLGSGAVSVGADAAGTIGQVTLNKTADAIKSTGIIDGSYVDEARNFFGEVFEGSSGDMKDIANGVIDGAFDTLENKWDKRAEYVDSALKSKLE